MPRDGASQIDHYVYGLPRRSVIEVLADTFYWVALTNPNDFRHRDAVEIGRKLRTAGIVTTDEVLLEFMTFF
jgi:hypothetical protein